MDRKLTIFYTSDVHGYVSPMDYATGAPAPVGLSNCAANFEQDGNSLILDGGDLLQGSPFSYWLQQRDAHMTGAVPAALMNLAGFQYVTIGNHDFNYGREILETYLNELNAICLCANIHGLPQVRRTDVVTLANGLRIGLTGITTPFITRWEKPEHLTGITITDPVKEAREALAELRSAGVDLALCIYHGGFEADVETGRILSVSGENQAWRICRELEYDILLTGHQHIALPSACIRNTWTCQPPDKARSYIRMEVSVSDTGRITAESRLLPAGGRTHPEMSEYLKPLQPEFSGWLDRQVGTLDVPLQPEDHLSMALHGSLIANFFNQVQLAMSGAELSATSLANEISGFNRRVSIRDIVATYVYPNTLSVIKVNREVLKKALERSAEYFELDGKGELRISDRFLQPKEEHYNFDYIAGIEAVIDVSRPCGSRVLSMHYRGEEIPPDREFTLCLNNYRAAGSGDYDFYADCETVSESPKEIVEMIMDYIVQNRSITVDKSHWLTVYNGKQLLS